MTSNEAIKLFAYEHLPEHLQAVSKPFFDQAAHICGVMEPSPYRTKALNSLWEAKNWAVAGVAQK
jgi:hypothetical protein